MRGYRSDADETDRALQVLSHACRRRVLFELYEEVNSGERGAIDYTDVTQNGTECRHLILYHTHLPKLEECGYIEWYRAEKTIRTGPRWEEIEPLLELLSSHLDELPPFLRGKPSGDDGDEY
ncbi:hypothetical protein U4E84_14890 [Halorubrum sp. AD140]|uniref:DUF7344 domain-containing protein n=1 Tax=Halorubrum sp. AD140 TaxID=3050073 RepID=UPI002ACC5E2B|nr:hypothetical protein [Halorubrum sp. AD140]MDZ5812632.1 hypothetical protein [Halorubrum sp. AD140]